MTFRPEPPYRHGTVPRTAVLLVNLGTPAAPTAPALRTYLAEFLSDPRVVGIPPLVWLPILHGIILRVRPAKSAAKYASIWTPEGSPLAVYTQRVATMLQGWLGERGHDVVVRHAMRYGQPSVARVMDALRAEGVTRVLVVPLYPQYAGATTASVIDAVTAWARRARHVPELRFVNHYHDEPAYIDSLAERIEAHWAREGRGRTLVMSFHGVPHRTLELGDPYHCECHKTARLLARRLGLADGAWRVTFQSRFGKARWLEPYTEPTLRELAASGVDSVDLVCPGFATDCLETLEEIAQEARDAFIEAGGRQFRYIPCLNDSPQGLNTLVAVAERHLAGWPTARAGAATPATVAPSPAPTAEAAQAQRQQALALGAPD
jgi:protoporphyrin/coproporphyrin ferrochelatase